MSFLHSEDSSLAAHGPQVLGDAICHLGYELRARLRASFRNPVQGQRKSVIRGRESRLAIRHAGRRQAERKEGREGGRQGERQGGRETGK